MEPCIAQKVPFKAAVDDPPASYCKCVPIRSVLVTLVGCPRLRLGLRCRVERIGIVKLHLVVGDVDTGISRETISDVIGGQSGATGRVSVLEGLRSEWANLGIKARLDIVFGVDHDVMGVHQAMTTLFKGDVLHVNATASCA